MRSIFESSPILAPLATHVLPILLLSLALGLFYKLTPNTTVEWRAAAIGGLCAGVTWHGYNQLGFVLVSRAMSASKFYGGVFLIVLLMGGLYILWLILLSGAQIAYAWQNRTAYLQDRLADNVNQRGREFVALRIMTCLGRRFQNGLPPATVPEISTELGVPSRLTASILCTLAVTAWSRRWPARKPPSTRRDRWRPLMPTIFCWPCAPAPVRNCRCPNCRSWRKFTANSPASNRPSAMPPQGLRCSHSRNVASRAPHLSRRPSVTRKATPSSSRCRKKISRPGQLNFPCPSPLRK